MFSLEAVTAHNGWAMAATGAAIVLLGLSVLALIISQLYKIIALFDRQVTPPHPPLEKPAPTLAHLSSQMDILNDLDAALQIYKSLTLDEGDNFKLERLYALCAKEQMPHPHLTIRSLRDNGRLVPTGDGTYSWKNC